MKWTIGKKIILLGIIPSLAVVFFLYVILQEKISVKTSANNVSERCDTTDGSGYTTERG